MTGAVLSVHRDRLWSSNSSSESVETLDCSDFGRSENIGLQKYVLRWFEGTSDSDAQDVWREPIRGAADLDLLGVIASKDALLREHKRDLLSRLIAQFAMEGYSRDCERSRRIAQETAKAATALIRSLPKNFDLPRVAPDDDGALAMLWTDGGKEVLGLLDEWQLHIVQHPGSPNAIYHEPFFVGNEGAPSELLDMLG